MNTNEAVKNDLNQVRTEEKSILNYLGTKNSKESIEKIQMYRQLVAKSNDQDIIHKTLLSGKNINELRKNEIELDRESVSYTHLDVYKRQAGTTSTF